MTFEQLIQELFVNHWLFMTVCFPQVTFIYAWITDQTAWWFWSLVWATIIVTTDMKK